MSMCYVCEKPSETRFCCVGCENQYEMLSQLAQAADTTMPKLVAYSDMSLFEPVDLGLSDEDEEDELGKFAPGPLCIEAIPQQENKIVFIVKERQNTLFFEPRQKEAKTFNSASEAQKFIEETLKPKFKNWNFRVWSLYAIPK